jgi:polyphenol oxidase
MNMSLYWNIEMSLSPLTINNFNDSGIFHGFFSRHGGVSSPPWDSLNVGFSVEDKKKDVLENRQRIKNFFKTTDLISLGQVHGDAVLTVETDLSGELEFSGYDAMVTDQPGKALMIQQADCQAVLLFDPIQPAIGIAHSGWRGNVLNIISATVEKMIANYNSEPTSMTAAISPSLGPCCAEFKDASILPGEFMNFQSSPEHFDFWQISKNQLLRAGLKPDNIFTAGVCTVCSEDYFSYRREKVCGRAASVIGLCR